MKSSWLVPVAASLGLASAVFAGSNADRTGSLPLFCNGTYPGAGHANLNTLAGISGSVAVDRPFATDEVLYCSIFCNNDFTTDYAGVPCGTVKKGHRSVSFKLKPANLSPSFPDLCLYPSVAIDAGGADVFCVPVWVPKHS
ncbi:MAG TPA: hypothetical protein VMR50_13080 [Myxococcota bacterium]|nr:hypothetical protein [Myxococcota bacterium]